MSTSRQHIEQLNRVRFTFDEIDARFEEMDSAWIDSDATLVAPTAEQLYRQLTSLWHAVEPILTVVAGLPLLRPAWSDALKLFIAITSQVVASNPGAGFKAGKDL
jgi:hypothetical protein